MKNLIALTLLVICSFSMLGCTVNKISDQDRKRLTNEIKMGALESKNTQLTDENTELKKKNENLEEHVSQLTDENTELKKKNKNLEERVGHLEKDNTRLTEKIDELINGNGPGPFVHPKPDKILRVGDKLSSFNDDEIDLKYFIYSNRSTITTNGTRNQKNVMKFQKGSQIKLKNGTHYICTNPDGCEIVDFVITKGSIEVYYNKE